MPLKRRTIKSYIAVGCLALDLPSIGDANTTTWPSLLPDHWLQFKHSHHSKLERADTNGDSDSDSSPLSQGLDLRGIEYHSFSRHALEFLPPEIQQLLFSSQYLSPFQGLFREQWIHLSFGMHPLQKNVGVVRVYILPDDVDNRTISRTNPSLKKARQRLLSQLDFGWTAYMGVPHGVSPLDRFPSPIPWEQRGAPTATQPSPKAQSLLEMFNNIPSPSPTLEAVNDLDAREAVDSICTSTIPGLETVLYAYQRRSAALMLQRETQKQQVLDPRLSKVIDQLGKPWYYDAVAGTCLMEPRYYDGPCGGILAEEMGSGKTLICLALILATRHIPSTTPEVYRSHDVKVRPKVGSLADMAAACITRHSVPWKRIFASSEPDGFSFARPVAAIQRNPESYIIPQQPHHSQRRNSRAVLSRLPLRRVRPSHTSLVIVPPNLVQQWRQEISKHTSGLKVLVVNKICILPSTEELLDYDILLFSSTRFERLPSDIEQNPLAGIHFKRCIIDEGHKLGNSTLSSKSNLHLVVNLLQITAKWIVTGTPSKGLYGVDNSEVQQSSKAGQPKNLTPSIKRLPEASDDLENDDLKRIGSIATYYLQMRPWANSASEAGDTPADWAEYVIQTKQSRLSTKRRTSSIKSTLEALIIRHRLSDLGNLLPPVDEKFVYLDGSYQDILAQNLFSMMIIFNAVQSERTDQDYFFHPRQRKALVELVSNLRQASFFGGSFFSPAQISRAVETAEKFLAEGKVKVSAQDEALLRSGIELGKLGLGNTIKENAHRFREIPIYLQHFPWRAGRAWSLDEQDDDPACTSPGIVAALQRLVQPLVDAPESLRMMYESGRFAAHGQEQRLRCLEDQVSEQSPAAPTKMLAGNTDLGQDNGSKRRRSAIVSKAQSVATPEDAPRPSTPLTTEGINIAPPLAETQLVSTASAKLSYLIDQVVRYQDEEQIIIFYENDNVAYYLASVLEILQIQHLIYARGLTPERRSQYVATFNNTTKFRVLLMDITQAAFGLDMKSASRIYFISPVLNPQVEAQAIGRARRISQQKPVTVETLVLRGSVEEVIVRRRGEMTQAEQRKCRSILDDKPIYEWILNAKILKFPGSTAGNISWPDQMAKLARPQFIFGRDFGRGAAHPDEDLVNVDLSPSISKIDARTALKPSVGFGNGSKEAKMADDLPSLEAEGRLAHHTSNDGASSLLSPSKKRIVGPSPGHSSPAKKKRPTVRFAGGSDDEATVPRAVVKLGTPTPV